MFDALGVLALGQIPVELIRASGANDDISRPGPGAMIMLHSPGQRDGIDDDDALIMFAVMEGIL